MGGGGASEVLPLQKGGGMDIFLSHAEGGGGTNSFGVVLTWEFVVLAILKGARKVSDPGLSHFVASAPLN